MPPPPTAPLVPTTPRLTCRTSSPYVGLNLPLLTVDERLDVLLHVKWTVKEFDCDLTRELVDLIDREADLLNRGRNPKVCLRVYVRMRRCTRRGLRKQAGEWALNVELSRNGGMPWAWARARRGLMCLYVGVLKRRTDIRSL